MKPSEQYEIHTHKCANSVAVREKKSIYQVWKRQYAKCIFSTDKIRQSPKYTVTKDSSNRKTRSNPWNFS